MAKNESVTTESWAFWKKRNDSSPFFNHNHCSIQYLLCQLLRGNNNKNHDSDLISQYFDWLKRNSG